MRPLPIIVWALVLMCLNSFAADTSSNAKALTPAIQGVKNDHAENSSMNVRDQSGSTLTPQNQTNAADDRQLLAAVRRIVVNDKTLSSNAHNIKIMVGKGVVTLRGPVKSEAEKSKIETLAKHINGVSSVENYLDVKTN